MSEAVRTFDELLNALPQASGVSDNDTLVVVTSSGLRKIKYSDLLGTVKSGGLNQLKGANVEQSGSAGVQAIGSFHYADTDFDIYQDLTLTLCYSLQSGGTLLTSFTTSNLYPQTTLKITESGTKIIRTFHIKPIKQDEKKYNRMNFYKLYDYSIDCKIHWAVLTCGTNIGVSEWIPSAAEISGGGKFLPFNNLQFSAERRVA